MIRIPLYKASLQGREKEYVLDCLESSWVSAKGKYVQLFEERFGNRIQVTHAASVCNGTAALHLALLALGIGPGDEVIVPTLTYIASVNTIAYTGATPVFVDSIRSSWQMDPEDVRKKITSKTRAIMIVHLYGHPCEIDALAQIAEKHGLFVVENCAEAFGALFKGKHVGGFGQISAFSFYGNKTITTGEGGMVATNDRALYERAVHFKWQGLVARREYWHDVIGYNYRMSNICAAVGLAQLEQADEFIEKKRKIAEWYRETLQDLPLECHREVGDVKHSYWMNSILLSDADKRDALRDHLAKHGIETRPLFNPIHTMPMYGRALGQHPVAEYLGCRGINLPSWPGLDKMAVSEISHAIRVFFG